MSRFATAGGLWLALSLLACNPQPPKVSAKSSGSLALSGDDSTLYVADADHDRVTVIDARSRQVTGHVPVGKRPERVLVADDGTVYVTNRGERTVSRIAPGAGQADPPQKVGAEPVGMALAGDRLLVANSMSGTVSVLDAKTMAPLAEHRVGGQPWALATTADGKQAYVTDFIGGELKVLDVSTGQLTSTVTLDQPPSSECWSNTTPRTPAQPADVVVSPDGERAYIAHVQSRTLDDGQRSRSMALAVAPSLATVTTSNNQHQKEPEWAATETTTQPDFPAPNLSTNVDSTCSPVPSEGMDAPSSLVVDGSGEWIFVADHNSNAIAVVSATRRGDARFQVPERGIYKVAGVGARPTGIAVSADLKTAYVHNALDYTVSVIENPKDAQTGARVLAETAKIEFAQSNLPPDVERGRRLFFSATDPRVTQPQLGGVSCSSCHPDGRTDGLSWVLPDPDSRWNDPLPTRRNTPALWALTQTAPYHWDGLLQDLPAFTHVMVTQMGGAGLADADVHDLSAFLRTIEVPDNPNRDAVPPSTLAAGEQLFAQKCGSCHAGQALTDNQQHATTGISLDRVNTPTLRGVFATPPYLHSGRAATLRDVLKPSGATITGHRGLSDADAATLERYLSTL